MIENIRFNNFKRFKEESLDLTRPITLLYGQNSSGKSSALKGIAALLQTFSWMRNKHEPLVTQGDYANLGVYKDYVHDHRTANKITFNLLTKAEAWSVPFANLESSITHLSTKLCYDRSPYTEQARIYLIEGGVKLSDGSERLVFTLKRAETKAYYTITVDPDALKAMAFMYGRGKDALADKEIKRLASLKTKLKYIEGFSFSLHSVGKEDDVSSTKIRVLERYMYALFQLHEKYKYLGPLRSSPNRSYTLSAASSDVGPKGENTPSVISYLKRSSESIKDNKDAYLKILRWIKLLFPGRSIEVEDYEELVKLKITRKGVADSIQDVGFGFSQILPIIVQAAALKPGNTLVIEQPELHLHPSAQVAFSKFLVEASRSGIRFIIETHSEHLLRGLQLAISENSISKAVGISKSDLRVVYFPSEEGNTSFEIEINDDGELVEGWPAGFFDESYNLTKQMINNKISKLAGKSL
ncbi:DUF3696 domain-containing protein [Pseudomonas fulva]|uniref:AAA family ATPase n=1 Tax=Pseudomonas fulva TaxID=47880 RepID=UPI00201D2FE8|nr:DUF3696 domain-containing protein [Pseudomonas fulva]UQY35514.1 DUF3696 domain-containing protein [Pseudomonas fulva]